MKPTPGYPLPTRREKWESLSTEYDSWSQWHALGHLAYKMHERLTLHHLKEEKHSYKRLLISLAGKQDFKSGNSQIINLYLETHKKKKKSRLVLNYKFSPRFPVLHSQEGYPLQSTEVVFFGSCDFQMLSPPTSPFREIQI
jgi:hypothetical protein